LPLSGARAVLARALLLAASAAFVLACAHTELPARPKTGPQSLQPELPRPDPEAILDAEGCRPGEAARGCPAEAFEVAPYVSARSLQHLIQAQLARQQGDWQRAAAQVREALLYDPESAFLHTELADALVRLGRIADAEEELKAALKQEPAHPAARLLLGRIASARGRPAEARGHFNAAREAQPEAPEPLRERIRLELAQGELSSAEALARELAELAQRKTQAAALAERAAGEPAFDPREGLELGPPDPAGALVAQAQRLREEAAWGEGDLARALAERHEDPKAAEAFAKAEALSPGSAELVQSRAGWLESRRRFAEARDAWLRLYAQRPDAPEILAALCRVSLEAGEPDAAEVHLRKLLELAADAEPPPAEPLKPGQPAAVEPPERVEARRDAASALLRAGLPLLGARRTTLALLAFDEALRLLDGEPELLLYRGLALLQKGRAKEAAQAFDQAALRAQALLAGSARAQPGQEAQDPPRTLLGAEVEALLLDARVQGALARGRAGETELSLKRLKAIFEKGPAEGDVALGLLEGFDRAGRLAEAVQLLTAAQEKLPQNVTLLFALATAHDRAQAQEKAVQLMRRVLQLSPDHAGALNYVGYTLTERGRPEDLAEAEPMLSRAVELRPDEGAVADSFGLLLFKRGRVQEALAELQRASALTPGDPVILSHLGDALLASGRREEAAAAFRRALLRLSPPAGAAAARDDKRRDRTALALPKGDGDEAAEAAEGREPEPGDARVKAELEAKLRSLTSR
jgi:Flp pilus assembly protein TadD